MVDEVDEFLFRRFIPEENRGGIHHVVLFLNGKNEGPFTPEQSADKGWPLPAVHAAINANVIAELNAEKAKTEKLQGELGEASALITAAAATLKHERELSAGKDAIIAARDKQLVDAGAAAAAKLAEAQVIITQQAQEIDRLKNP